MEKDTCCGISPIEMEEIEKIQKNMKAISALGGLIHFHREHVVFYEGHAPYGFYIIKKGDIQLSRTNMQGQKVFLPSNGQKIFGLFHLITNTPFCSTAQAKTDSEILFIPKSVVLEFLHHH